MSQRARSIVGVVIMSALLLLYFGFAGVRAIALIASGTVIAVLMGIALLVLPVIGVWALCREIWFGWRATAMIDWLDQAGRLPDDLGEQGPTGKPDREIADAAFPRYQAEVQASPNSWEAWARLGIVYNACGDRTRARAAMRQAIRLNRDEIR